MTGQATNTERGAAMRLGVRRDSAGFPMPRGNHRFLVLVRIVVAEICSLPHRISANLEIQSGRIGPGHPIAEYPEDDRKLTDDEASTFLSAYRLCMERLMRKHRFFGCVELQICNQAFHEGAKCLLRSSGN